MTNPCAADDFTVIRARLEELRRERVRAPVQLQGRPLSPLPYHASSEVTPKAHPRRLPPAIRKKLFR